MNIGTICQRNVVTVRPFDDLTAAAQLMREKHIGYIVVAQPDLSTNDLRPVGVLTDRDIVIAVVAGQTDPRTLRVEDVMTRDPVTVPLSASLPAALQEMRRIGVRRMPVLGPRSELVGVLSLDDILDTLAGQLQDVAGSIRNERRIETALRP